MRVLHRFAPIALVAAVGCGKQGLPLPPAPHGPLPPAGVEARQVGAEALVSFTVPEPRGIRSSQAPERAELVRVDYPPGPTPPSDADAFRRRGEVVAAVSVVGVAPGTRKTLADATLAGPGGGRVGWTLRYGVRVLDRRGRVSPTVVARDLVLVETLPPPTDLAGEATADGVRLEWRPPPGQGAVRFNVYRARVGEPKAERPLQREPVLSSEYLDAEATAGTTYLYEVRTASPDGTSQRESESSPALRIEAVDLFPPAPPATLVAVQEGPAVRLFWNPSQERDLAGYRVYRREGDRDWGRIGPDLVDRLSFLDPDVRARTTFSYRVTAVDRATPPNESAPSNVADVVVALDPTAGEPARP